MRLKHGRLEHWRLKRGIAAVLLALAPVAAPADTGLRALTSMTDSRGFEAVGRLEFADRAFCTGSLIAPDVVLTAAHCLYDRSGRQFAPAEIRFLAGFRDGRALATRSVRAAVPHPGYRAAGQPVEGTAIDLALLRLDQPVANGLVTPFGLAPPPGEGDRVSVVSYAFDRPDNPALQEECRVLQWQSGVMVLSCDVDFGSSGSPVFVRRHGVPFVVSVISAKAEAEGRKISLGARLDEELTGLHRLLDEASLAAPDAPPQVRRMTVGSARTIDGAKFIRP